MAGLYRARLEGRVGGRPRKKPLPTKSDILNGENLGDNNGGFS